jgi:L-fuconolactonase
LIDGLARVSQDPDSVARLRLEMNGAGINRAVLFGADSRVSVEFLADLRRGDPAHFAAVGTVDPLAPGACHAVEEARYRWGMAGIELGPAQRGHRWLNAPGVMPLWERLEGLELCVSLCIASQDYNQFSDVVTGFPRLRIVLEDLGSGPETMLYQYVPILLEYARYPQVHVGVWRLFRISAQPHPYPDLWPVLEEIYRAFGSQRLVWGSGYPEVNSAAGGYPSAARLLGELPFLKAADLEMIQEANAARLWFG